MRSLIIKWDQEGCASFSFGDAGGWYYGLIFYSVSNQEWENTLEARSFYFIGGLKENNPTVNIDQRFTLILCRMKYLMLQRRDQYKNVRWSQNNAQNSLYWINYATAVFSLRVVCIDRQNCCWNEMTGLWRNVYVALDKIVCWMPEM